MNIFKSLTKVSLIAGVFLIASCESLDEINVNPNGVPTSEANANLYYLVSKGVLPQVC